MRSLWLRGRWRALAGIVWLSAVSGEAVSAAAPRFVEVTVEAGIDFRYINGASGAKYMPEAVGSGAAFFDGDGDGFLDLYIVNGAALPGYAGPTGSNAYYRNRADGAFVNATVESGTGDEVFGMGAAVGDIDSDGDFPTSMSPIMAPTDSTKTMGVRSLPISRPNSVWQTRVGARTRLLPTTMAMAISISTSPTIWILTQRRMWSVSLVRCGRIAGQRPIQGKQASSTATTVGGRLSR